LQYQLKKRRWRQSSRSRFPERHSAALSSNAAPSVGSPRAPTLRYSRSSIACGMPIARLPNSQFYCQPCCITLCRGRQMPAVVSRCVLQLSIGGGGPSAQAESAMENGWRALPCLADGRYAGCSGQPLRGTFCGHAQPPLRRGPAEPLSGAERERGPWSGAGTGWPASGEGVVCQCSLHSAASLQIDRAGRERTDPRTGGTHAKRPQRLGLPARTKHCS
jgi:hypothetical protein